MMGKVVGSVVSAVAITVFVPIMWVAVVGLSALIYIVNKLDGSK